MIILYNTITPVLGRNFFSFGDPEKQSAILCAAMLESQGAEGVLWLKTSKKRRTLSSSLQRTEFCQQPQEFRSRFLLSQTSYETETLANTLIACLSS